MLLNVSDICKSFDDFNVLDSVSLEIEPGGVMSLCGPSGCGKTTLIRVIAGLCSFDSGHMVIDDQSIRPDGMYPQKLHGRVGVVFQEHNLMPHMTALQNVMLGLRHGLKLPRKEAHDRAMAELANMSLSDKASQYPASLSGGQRQRVAIARALATDPLVLLLDEPTSGLDSSLIGEVLGAIERLCKDGMTMLLVTHNLRFARHAGTQFALMHNGRVEISGDPGLLDDLDQEWT
ncbi:MAG: ATP-binding cassette domain-containing protein [Phycisphaerae bacterium]|jgi:ABC-type polar amino acid transport system ATPase subunit|nr:ATP-binding cassette domain-containing protein [Phycisphaerae bacterium]